MSDELFIERDASISECGRYRWTLTRQWRTSGRRDWLGWIMLNPSTADALNDDPTIRRCIGFAQRWGFNGICVCNLYALRATDPRDLFSAPNPVGPDYDHILTGMIDVCPEIMCAWGAFDQATDRAAHVVKLLRGYGAVLKCLGLTKEGHPKHPLYVPASTPSIPFEGRCA